MMPNDPMGPNQFNGNDNKNNVYFAANPDPKKVASSCMDKGQSFYNLLRANAYIEKIHRMWRFYHGSFTDDLGYSHKIDFTGEQGEYTNLMVNHFRNIAYHIYTMITSSRPIMEARAINTDYKSLSQTYLANGILEYYMREKGLEEAIKAACEMSIVLGSAFIKMEWNATAGDAYEVDEETGETIYEGEMEFTNLSPLDVVVDGTKEKWCKEWVIVRSFQNRFNLIAKYPEYADQLKGLPAKNESPVYRLSTFSNDDTDDIPVYEFYHERCESLPDGRYMLFATPEIVLMDTKLPYRVVPVFRISPSDIMGTPYGYTPMFDLFPLQQAVNSLFSTIMTNQAALGVQSLYVQRGADVNMIAFEGGMNIIEANSKPEPLQLTETPAEIFKFLEMCVQHMETISGVNSVTRGNPEASLRTGNALALVQSMSLQFMSGLQQSYVRLIEEIGTALIQTLKDYVTTPKVVALVGKNKRTYLKEFTGESISSINRVIVDVGNPLSRTIAGRSEMAQNMMQMGLIKNGQQYFEVLETGRLDVAFEGEMNEMLLVKKENELLADGQQPITAPVDNHMFHINEHKAVISDPEVRGNPELVQRVMQHIQEHMDMLRETDPDLLNLTGQQALAPQTPPGPPPGTSPSGNAPQQPNSNTSVLSNQTGPVPPGSPVQGPGVPNVPMPGNPKVAASLLPNPALQDQSMGNVNHKK